MTGKRPPHLCYYPGCFRQTHKRYCAMHQSESKLKDKKYNPHRAVSDKAYNLKSWRRLREKKHRHNPFCEHCLKENRVVQAELIDHIVPVKQGGPMLAWDNLQSLCRKCHDVKTMRDNEKYSQK